MASWDDFAAASPDLASKVRARLEANKHHILATLRRDGSPRVSGTEVRFFAGELVLGSMHRAVKVADLRRDARFALHANPGDGSMEGGDAKLAGRAVEITDEATLARFRQAEDADRAGDDGRDNDGGERDEGSPEPFHLLALDIGDVVLTEIHPDGDRLVITTWTPAGGLRSVERR